MDTADKLITENLDVWTSAVKAKSSSRRGSSNKREVYGIQKLRELILDFAVRGMLVPQDPSEGTAADDFDSLSLNRETSKLKRTKIDASVKTGLLSVPDNWISVKLGEVASIRTGFAFKSSNYAEDGTFILRVTNINPDGSFNKGDVVFLPDAKLDEKMRGFLLEENELLVVMVGGSLGKIGEVSAEILPALLNQNMWRLLPYSEKYYYRFLRLVLRDLNDNRLQITASTHGHLAMGVYAASQIPFPPLAEQHRIVAKVDELMALCDQLEQEQESSLDTHDTLVATLLGTLTTATADAGQFTEAWQRVQANFDILFTTESSIDQLKQTILQLAVMGKLVPQDSEDEPAEKLLERIALTLPPTKGRRSNNTANVATEPFSLPENWSWAKFPQLGEFGRGKSKHRPRNDPSLYEGGTHKLIQTGDVARSEGQIKTHTALYNETGLAQSRKWPAGTLCITIAANIADSGILSFDACFPDSVVGFIPAKAFSSAKYFEYFLRTAKDHLDTFASSTAQKNINLGILEQLMIPVPPETEQHRIVAKVDELMVLCDQLKASLATAQTTQLNLADSLVEQAIG